MRKWMTSALLAAGLVAGETAAQDKVAAPKTTTQTEVITTQPRSGLLGRRVGRREVVTTTVQPGTTAQPGTKVQQAQGIEPAPVQTAEVMDGRDYRPGLLSRLRMRLGR